MFPLYSIVKYNDLVICGGGGGSSKTGVKNGFVVQGTEVFKETDNEAVNAMDSSLVLCCVTDKSIMLYDEE